MAEQYIDLHSHTHFSDGTLSPKELVLLAQERDLAALAITDHDLLLGLEPAKEAAKEFLLEIVPGLEMSTTLEGSSLHILGLCVDPHFPALHAYSRELVAARFRRAHKMVEKLVAVGIEIQMEDVLQETRSPNGAIGRPHVARALMKKKIVQGRQEAFDRFLAKGRPAYVPYEHVHPREAIDLIHAAGGKAFLAHPKLVRNPDLVLKVIELGLDGLEVIHPEHDERDVARYSQLCRERHLLQTGGSDYHGPNVERKGDLGAMKVPYRFLEEIWKAL